MQDFLAQREEGVPAIPVLLGCRLREQGQWQAGSLKLTWDCACWEAKSQELHVSRSTEPTPEERRLRGSFITQSREEASPKT